MRKLLCILLSAIFLIGATVGAEESRKEKKLTVTGGLPFWADQMFRERHPQIELSYIEPLDTEEFIRRMTTQDSAIDLYYLKADFTFSSMKEKRLVTDLSCSGIISVDVKSMDANIREVICDRNGRPVAYPNELFVYRYGINEGYWRMLWGERPLPQTFDEVLDAWIEWERDYAEDYPGVGFIDYPFDYNEQIYAFVLAYVMQNDAGGLPDLENEALKSVLIKLREVYEIRLALGRSVSADQVDEQINVNNDTGPGRIFYMQIGSPLPSTHHIGASAAGDYFYGVPKSQTTYLPIVFDEQSQKETHASMNVWVVNPYSEHTEEAILALECLTEVNANPEVYYAVHPEVNDPYADPLYEETKSRMEKRKAEYEAALLKAQEKGVPDETLALQLEYCTAWLADENQRWRIHEDDIRLFRQITHEAPLDLHADSPYVAAHGTTSQQVFQDICQRYAEGNLSLDAFLKEISSRMKMIYLEEQ